MSQKFLKRKIVADEINALKEKRVKLIFEIEMLCVDADLITVNPLQPVVAFLYPLKLSKL